MGKKSNKRKYEQDTTKFDRYLYDDICLLYKEKYKKPEEWRNVIIDGYVTKFAISNYGRIVNIETEEIPRIYRGRGHFYTSIYSKNNKTRRIGTYRLVAMMFIDVPEIYGELGYEMEDLLVDHKRDGDRDNFYDNTVWNLQWLTTRENTSKASKCGYRKPFSVEFKERLDKMILDDCDNKEIYKMCKEYGYEKDEIKSMIQVRRRRLNKTLKEHYEHDKKFVKTIDILLKQGLSNDEIIKKLKMPTDTRTSTRLLQYRRSILKIPANPSRHFTIEQNEMVRKFIEEGLDNEEIINRLGMNDLDKDKLRKINATLTARKRLYKKSIASSTTIENIA